MCACEMKVQLNKEFLDTRSGIRIGDRSGSNPPISISTTDGFCSCEGFIEPFEEEVRVEMFAGAEGRVRSNDADNCVLGRSGLLYRTRKSGKMHQVSHTHRL